MSTIRVVTRGSLLAVTQTGQLVDQLRAANPGVDFETITVTTRGDRVTDRPLSSFRGTGVFVKELQKSLLDGHTDLAVHSLKDVPADEPDGLVLAAYSQRQSPWDLLMTRDGTTLKTLARGAVIGTSSPRRLVQLKAARPDVVFADLRGNLDTRLRKLDEGQYDAIVVAAAGMNRLGKEYPQSSVLDLDVCIPAVGQGALAVECRSNDSRTREIVGRIDDASTAGAVTAERAFMIAVGGGCTMPLAAHGWVEDGRLRLVGMVGDPVGGRLVRAQDTTANPKAEQIGQHLASTIKKLCDSEGISLE